MPSLAATYIMKASNTGMTIGTELGNIEGELKGTAKCLLRILTKRFQTVPKAVEEDILATTDQGRLDTLIDIVLDCESLDKFAEALAKTPNAVDTLEEKCAVIVEKYNLDSPNQV